MVAGVQMNEFEIAPIITMQLTETHLSFSMGPTPILKMAVSYGLRPRLWLLVLRISGHSGFLRNLPTNTTIFFRSVRLCEKADLSKGYQNPKRKMGLTTQFSEIIELKVGENAIHSLYFNAFLKLWLINYL